MVTFFALLLASAIKSINSSLPSSPNRLSGTALSLNSLPPKFSIYMACPEGDGRTELLVQRGGTNLLAALLYFGIVLLLSSLVINLAGPGFVQYAMAMAGY